MGIVRRKNGTSVFINRIIKKMCLSWVLSMFTLGLLLLMGNAVAHGVASGDQDFLMANQGAQLLVYLYLGAKHMVTKAVASLAEKSKIEKSWQSVKAAQVEKKTFKGNTEWVVTFNNSEISDPAKRTLYVFLTLGGEYFAVNHTGK